MRKLKIPHMGWSNLKIKKETAFIKKLKTKLEFEKVSAYFVHSYNFLTKDENNKIMTAHYGPRNHSNGFRKQYNWNTISPRKE